MYCNQNNNRKQDILVRAGIVVIHQMSGKWKCLFEKKEDEYLNDNDRFAI